MGRRLRVAAALAGACGSIAFAAAPAHATIYDRFSFTFEGSVEEDVCGIAARIDSVDRGRSIVRTVDDGLGQAFVGHGNLTLTDTFTNLDTGESFAIVARIREGDLSGEQVDGDLYRFTLTRAGIERVIDGDGDVVLKDSGLFRMTYLFDTLGDGEPGGEFVEELSVSVRGPHPLLAMDDEAFCAMVHELIG